MISGIACIFGFNNRSHDGYTNFLRSFGLDIQANGHMDCVDQGAVKALFYEGFFHLSLIHIYISKGKRIFTSVPVYNDQEQSNLYGVTDCLEFIKENQGVSIKGSEENFNICIVEYKPTKPKNKEYNE